MFPAQLVNPPDSESPFDSVRGELLLCGFSKPDAEWLAGFLLSPGILDADVSIADSAKSVRFLEAFDIVRLHVREHSGDRDVQLAAVLLGLVGLYDFGQSFKPVEPVHLPSRRETITSGEPKMPGWVAHFLDESKIAYKSLLGLLKVDWIDHAWFIYNALLPRLDLGSLIAWDKLPPSMAHAMKEVDSHDWTRLTTWFHLELQIRRQESERDHAPQPGNSLVLQQILPALAAFPKASLPKVILGLLHSIQGVGTQNNLNPYGNAFQPFATGLEPIYQILEDPNFEDTLELRHARRVLASRTFAEEFGAYTTALTEATRLRLLQQAQADFGSLRATLRASPENMDWQIAEEAFLAIRCFGTPWQGIKLLLQAFRALPKQAVTRDLRYWNEPGMEETVHPDFVKIPMWIATSLYSARLKDELAVDPTLEGLREEFASYCLARLKTKNSFDDTSTLRLTNDDFAEPSALWRSCYAKAIRELRVNPRGKSHPTLLWSSKNDPEELVRAYAHEAYQSVRHEEKLPSDMSPRRPLMAAFWWLRQAHLLELQIPVDPQGAQRTRTKELRRIKESEHQTEEHQLT